MQRKWHFVIAGISAIQILVCYFLFFSSPKKYFKIPKTTQCYFKQLGNSSFLCAAYVDEREVVITAISNHSTSKENNYSCKLESIDGKWKSIGKAELKLHPKNFGYPYGASQFHCKIVPHIMRKLRKGSPLEWKVGICKYGSDVEKECTDKYVEIDINYVHNGFSPWKKQMIQVCVAPLFGPFSNYRRMVQTLEAWKFFGVDHVTLYHIESTDIVKDYLATYLEEGFVQIRDFPITSVLNASRGWRPETHPGDIHYMGQIPAAQDCFQGNRFLFDYIFFLDIDEIILPIFDKDWRSLLDRYSDKDLFYFFQQRVPPNQVSEKEAFDNPFAKGRPLPQLDIFQSTKAFPVITGKPHWQLGLKWGIRPSKLIWYNVHEPLQVEKTTKAIDVPPQEAHCQHYRSMRLKEEDMIEDIEFQVYERDLTKRIWERIRKVGFW